MQFLITFKYPIFSSTFNWDFFSSTDLRSTFDGTQRKKKQLNKKEKAFRTITLCSSRSGRTGRSSHSKALAIDQQARRAIAARKTVDRGVAASARMHSSVAASVCLAHFILEPDPTQNDAAVGRYAVKVDERDVGGTEASFRVLVCVLFTLRFTPRPLLLGLLFVCISQNGTPRCQRNDASNCSSLLARCAIICGASAEECFTFAERMPGWSRDAIGEIFNSSKHNSDSRNEVIRMHIVITVYFAAIGTGSILADKWKPGNAPALGSQRPAASTLFIIALAQTHTHTHTHTHIYNTSEHSRKDIFHPSIPILLFMAGAFSPFARVLG